jgi:hypothetical protein
MSFKSEFMERWEQQSMPNPQIEYATKEAGEMAGKMFTRQYASLERDNPVLRLSGIGKYSIVELLAKKFGLLPQGGDDTVSNECRLRFITGDLFECQMFVVLNSLGFEVLETQKTIVWNGVSGHTDFIVRAPSGEVSLVELKTANDYYFKQIKKWIGDERGYLTQLCTYSDATQLPAAWLFVNKNTSEVFIKELTDVPLDIREAKLLRAKKLIEAFNECPSFEDFPLFCQVPPPKIEKFKSGEHKFWEDGSLRLYVGDYDYKRPELFYVLDKKKNDYGKMRLYVTDYLYPEKYQDHKPDIQDQALRYDGRN